MRLRMKSIVVILLLAIVALITGGVILAASSFLSDLYKHESSDDDIIAIVQGFDVTRRPIRIGSEFLRSMSSELSQDESIQIVLNEIFTRKVLLAEAARLGIDATNEGYRDFLDAKTAFADPILGEPIREHIRMLGMTAEDYWNQTLPGYIEAATIVKLKNLHLQEVGLSEASYQQQWEEQNRYAANLLQNATIVWKDLSMKTVYESN